MKTLVLPFLAGLALATSALRAEVSAQAWLESYYLNPQPAALAARVQALSREGFLERPGNVPLTIGFLATVFAQHPARVDAWLQELRSLPESHQRLLAAALWQAGDARGEDLLLRLRAPAAVRTEIRRLATTTADRIADTAVLSPASMNLQWGAFLASGDERHVTRIFDAIGRNEPALGTGAQLALARNAAAHPRVLAICLAQLERQPSEIQSALRAAFRDAGAVPPAPRG
ncbi:MAG: hypothetical protein ACO3G4_05575 [Opitutaceae bacterium]